MVPGIFIFLCFGATKKSVEAQTSQPQALKSHSSWYFLTLGCHLLNNLHLVPGKSKSSQDCRKRLEWFPVVQIRRATANTNCELWRQTKKCRKNNFSFFVVGGEMWVCEWHVCGECEWWVCVCVVSVSVSVCGECECECVWWVWVWAWVVSVCGMGVRVSASKWMLQLCSWVSSLESLENAKEKNLRPVRKLNILEPWRSSSMRECNQWIASWKSRDMRQASNP